MQHFNYHSQPTNSTSIMPPSHDMASHPSSPPSEGGAESYKYEDTPDTRLTIFSPQDDSVKSSRLLNALTLSTGNNKERPVKFCVSASSSIHRMASMDSINSVVHDKDPFICSTPAKPQTTKLSATASEFEPSTCRLSSAKLTTGSGISNTVTTPKPMTRLPETVARSPVTGFQVYIDLPLSSTFSHALKISRSMRITTSSGRLDSDAINHYIVVSVELIGPEFRQPLTLKIEPSVANTGRPIPMYPWYIPR